MKQVHPEPVKPAVSDGDAIAAEWLCGIVEKSRKLLCCVCDDRSGWNTSGDRRDQGSDPHQTAAGFMYQKEI
jgi:hypothetical protein